MTLHYPFYRQPQYPVQCKYNCLKWRQRWQLKVETVERRDKIVVPSSDRANIKRDLAHKQQIGQSLWRFETAQFPRNGVVLPAGFIFWWGKKLSKCLSAKLLFPQNRSLWCFWQTNKISFLQLLAISKILYFAFLCPYENFSRYPTHFAQIVFTIFSTFPF